MGVGLRVFVENQTLCNLVFTCERTSCVFCCAIAEIGCALFANGDFSVNFNRSLDFFTLSLAMLVALFADTSSKGLVFFDTPFSNFFTARFAPLRFRFFCFPGASFAGRHLVILNALNFLYFEGGTGAGVVSMRTTFR